jgi:hypothetical protein
MGARLDSVTLAIFDDDLRRRAACGGCLREHGRRSPWTYLKPEPKSEPAWAFVTQHPMACVAASKRTRRPSWCAAA